MTLNHKKIETKNLTQPEKEQQIKQNKGWYFITFVQNLPNNRPYGFTLYDEPFVLLRDKHRKLVCYLLPLDDDTKIPNSVCVKSFPVVEKQGIIWFWRGKSEEADENLITTMTNFHNSVKDNEKMLGR
jgi:phenylpropionate dioxygenase-like ring-hydroxylating dioxygenase large terminal subunit